MLFDCVLEAANRVVIVASGVPVLSRVQSADTSAAILVKTLMPIVLPKDLRFGFVVALLFKSLRYINNIVRFNTHNIKLRTRLGIWKLPDYWLLLLNHSVI